MIYQSDITLEAEADFTVLATLSKILGPEIRAAANSKDLKQRLASKGFQIRQGYLATSPQGKLVCPLSMI